MELEQLLIDAEAHYENALDDMRYGYGYDFWRSHYGCDELSEKAAKLVWNVAKWVMTSDYCEGITKMFPTLNTAYLWKENGCPLLDPNTAVEVYTKAEKIAEKFDPEAIKVDDHDPFVVLVKDKNSGMEFWFESWVTDGNDIGCDWNQSMFSLYDEDDVLRKLLQEDCWVFDLVSSEALSFQESMGIVHQWENGEWHTTPEQA